MTVGHTLAEILRPKILQFCPTEKNYVRNSQKHYRQSRYTDLLHTGVVFLLQVTGHITIYSHAKRTLCTTALSYKQAELSQRWMRKVSYVWVPQKFSRVNDNVQSPTATSPKIFNGFLFGLSLWMCVQNLNFVALPIPEIMGGTHKIWTVHG